MNAEDQRIQRNEQKRLRVIENRSNESVDQRSQRLEQERLRVIESRLPMIFQYITKFTIYYDM